MKICCTSGECYDTFTEIQCMGCYSTDHCTGPVEVVTLNPEDMPIIEGLDLSGCTIYEGEEK